MNIRTQIFILCWLVQLILPLQAQRLDPKNDPIIDEMPMPQPIDSVMRKAIIDFTMSESRRFRIAMYQKILKIDSIYPDSNSRKLFESMPIIVEFPILKQYRYEPVFIVRSMNSGFRGGDPLYLRYIFEVIRRDRYIRNTGLENGVIPDTIQDPYGIPEGNLGHLIGKYDFIHAVYYYPPTHTLRMLGGYAFLSSFPKESIGNKSKETISEYFARTRLVQELYDRRYSTDGFNFLIGSGSRLPDTVGSYIKRDRKYICYLTSDGFRLYQRAKFIAIPVPLDEIVQIRTASHSTTPPIETIIQKQEPWDELEMIWFCKASNMTESNYVLGFPYYEMRRSFRNTPESPSELFVRIRGVTESEMDKIKKYKNVLMGSKIIQD